MCHRPFFSLSITKKFRYRKEKYSPSPPPLLGFIDDVEFYRDRDKGRIEYRSASRMGYHDMGTNAARMEAVMEDLSHRDQRT